LWLVTTVINQLGGEGVGPIIDDVRPIFIQIAEKIEDDIIGGGLPEESQVPSTNQFASFYQINPATAAKGVNLLVDQGILYKKRGIGMFVTLGAKEKLIEKRKEQFYEQYVITMIHEAKKLGITIDQLTDLVRRGDAL
jgi:DNA-binding transcriptional regulator YhcF (GntR family)